MNYLGSKRTVIKRLELRSQTMDEQKYLWDLLMIPEVNRYFLSVPRKFREKIKDWSIQEGIYQEKMKHANDSNVFEWSIFLKDTNECIGRIVCQEIDSNSPDIRDVGWLIDPIHQNKGYVTEAATSMLEFMFNDCDITAIHTGAAIENPVSWKVMEKLGFIRQDEIVNIESKKQNDIKFIWMSIDELKDLNFKPKVLFKVIESKEFVHLINKD